MQPMDILTRKANEKIEDNIVDEVVGEFLVRSFLIIGSTEM